MKRITQPIATKFAIVLCLLLTFQLARAQRVLPSELVNMVPTHIEKYDVSKTSSVYLVHVSFASDSITNPGVVSYLKDLEVFEVHLVYSDFRSVPDFNQPKLNENRYTNLKRIAPALFSNPIIKWKAISQTGCKSVEKCAEYFHGFAIYHRKMPTVAERELEIKAFAEAFEVEEIPGDTTYSTKRRCISRFYEPRSKWKRERGITYRRPGIWNRKMVKTYSTTSIMESSGSFSLRFTGALSYGSDTSVLAALSRNKDWNKMQIVVDVTGSMSPYMAQLTHWIALNQNIARVEDFIFFQDGDNKRDLLKKTGNVGGIYYVNTLCLDKIYEGMQEAMRNGGGGDAQENDVEAILYGIKQNADANEIVLVADNFAPIRDYSHIYRIKKPVHVIVCGSYGLINTQYLDLVYKTKGTIHTMEEDINKLYELNEGQSIVIGETSYRISGGKFKVIR